MSNWVCNECNFSDYTDAVSQEELDKWLQCSNCGGNEFHLVEDLKTDRDELRACNVEQSKDISDLRNDVRSLQKQFNDLYLAYAKEVEASKYWKDKFDVLEGKYIQLEKDHEALKKQFEIYKKSNK